MEYEQQYDIPDDPREFAEWLSRQTSEVKRAAQLFPLGYPLQLNERMAWVVGYTPEGEVVTIGTDPATLTLQELDQAVEACVLIDPTTAISDAARH